jgi:hypothetical protein
VGSAAAGVDALGEASFPAGLLSPVDELPSPPPPPQADKASSMAAARVAKNAFFILGAPKNKEKKSTITRSLALLLKAPLCCFGV